MSYDINWLQQRYDNNESIDYLFFWGHTNKTGEQVGKFLFSQWYPSHFVVDGITYPTAEHRMMAGKARLFNDVEILEKIINANTPKEAKDLGRQVKRFDATAWEQHCFTIVKEGNYHKFTQNKGYKEYLLATGNKVIVEASPVDTIWGIGLTQDSMQAKNPHQWRGQNLLGFALMEVRDRLR
ncbi:hypothetical protein SY85_05025 [Flavisolibacter tropicus]|uniref:NADAR domain-containing protein n=1 Tax=Flavisolibacter tropicus TaxID=1492898 RepID=A0A172U2W9_9BACT|nr:hypothetical protein SY85_05025 [Flavisolibacter tropicus]